MTRRWHSLLVFGLICAVCANHASAQAPKFPAPERYTPTAGEKAQLEQALASLSSGWGATRSTLPRDSAQERDRLADVEICMKAVEWMLRHDEFYAQNYLKMAQDILDLGARRSRALSAGEHGWTSAEGSTIRGYRSQVDGSVQPYAIILPRGYNQDEPHRLDVVLHGRGATLNEVRFMNTHEGKPPGRDQTGLVLHVFGRTNNAYRWAGETDVFEAIAAVKRNYRVDDRRIVLRGFSMGGAGAWHLGLHHPSRWCSVEAGAGFTETKNYARLKALPNVQAQALHIYDAVDYALNAFDVPMVGYGGENDPQLQGSVNIKNALAELGFGMKTEGLVTRGKGLDFLQVVGAHMGHQVDPASAAIMRRFHDEHAAAGRPELPKRIRFVTYTLNYPTVAWLTIAALERHYERTTIDARIDDGTIQIVASNVAALGIDPRAGRSVRFGEQTLALDPQAAGHHALVYFSNTNGTWRALDRAAARRFETNPDAAKRAGLQGPIDDAFTGPFLCVQGTGSPWNPAVADWAEKRLKDFSQTWDRYLRGKLLVKSDTDVTPQDIASSNLVLFGDPGSNRVIARVLADLPLKWTRTEIVLAGQHPAAEHVPVLIAPNPLNPKRYVVLNTGHTFGAREFAGTNALLFPKLGDFAVLPIKSPDADPVVAGYFDESWKPSRE